MPGIGLAIRLVSELVTDPGSKVAIASKNLKNFILTGSNASYYKTQGHYKINMFRYVQAMNINNVFHQKMVLIIESISFNGVMYIRKTRFIKQASHKIVNLVRIGGK